MFSAVSMRLVFVDYMGGWRVDNCTPDGTLHSSYGNHMHACLGVQEEQGAEPRAAQRHTGTEGLRV